MTVAAEDARGARSEPKTVEFTVAQAEAAPTPTRAAATPQTTKPPKATLAGQWKMNISKSRDPVRASFQRFLEQYAKEQGYPYVDPTFNANATQLFENMVWTSDGGAVLSLNTTDGRNFSFDYRNPSSGGVFTVKSASKDGTSLTVTGPMGQRITVDLQSSNTILASIHYPPALATQIVGFSASGGLTTQEYWDRVQ
ncbi:MAG: hypothetical protein NTW86_27640 [Candidatus Sumerlaeota bacterium]|nr:hypothetical protein [Candidatus Sumerlaeota bacterium]